MIIKYLGIFLLGFLLFSCGTPPAGWEGGGNGGGNGDGPPPVETQLFLVSSLGVVEGWTNTINSQTGWCHNPEDGTVSENIMDVDYDFVSPETT